MSAKNYVGRKILLIKNLVSGKNFSHFLPTTFFTGKAYHNRVFLNDIFQLKQNYHKRINNMKVMSKYCMLVYVPIGHNYLLTSIS